MRIAFFSLLIVLALSSCACRTDKGTGLARCERVAVPAFPVGANVVDLPDDKDDDPGNDGSRGYGSAAAGRTLDRLAALGLDGVVLPISLRTASVTPDRVVPGALLSPAGRGRLAAMIDQAHARGLFVVLVPHLLLDDGDWRGRLKPRDGFFASYRASVSAIAEIGESRCAEVLSAGVELKSLTTDPAYDDAFGALVASLRERFSGELTYSANWDEVATMRHWPLFDRVGVNAFYPLADTPGAQRDAIEERAKQSQAGLLALKERAQRPVWFLEVGFKAVPEPWIKPWLWPTEVDAAALPVDEEAQALAYRAVVDAMYDVPAVDGAFFWVVPSDLDDAQHAWRYEPAQGFSFVGKRAEDVVRGLAARPPARDDGRDG
jgi:hypothetical protein